MHGLLVLIIEDNRDISFILARVLEEAGFETEVVRSGDAALARLSTILPDVVVLDLNLPQVEGEDILGHIRSDPRLAATRVVISTAHTDLPRSIQDQADLVLAKPIDLDVLCDQVSHLVSCSS